MRGNYFVAVGPVIFFCYPYPDGHGYRAETHRPRQAVTACAVWRPPPHRGGRPRGRGQGPKRNSISYAREDPALASFALPLDFSLLSCALLEFSLWWLYTFWDSWHLLDFVSAYKFLISAVRLRVIRVPIDSTLFSRDRRDSV